MKKTYEKPAIFFENFKMSSSIAATCNGYRANLADENTCEYRGIEENGFMVTLFSSANGECQQDFCYHVMVPPTEVFGS